MPSRPRLPPAARILRLSFFSAYWVVITALCGSLGIAVVGGQVRFWSPPAGTVPLEADACLVHVRDLADELDVEIDEALERADQAPAGALPAYRRFAADWDLRWRRVRYGCGLDHPAADLAALAEAHDRSLGRRYSAETLVRRYAVSEGRERARISAALDRAGGAS